MVEDRRSLGEAAAFTLESTGVKLKLGVVERRLSETALPV